ncbi:MAG: ATP-binding protein [bacterium]
MIKARYITENIYNDLKDKMVFVGGPRQVGKTTLALYIADNYFKSYQYVNWDNRQDRKDILNSVRKPEIKLIVYDEIHKYKFWKNYLKGEYDKHKKDFDILVTGSARLDIYRKGGDSLLGRYRYYRLHPFSLSEFLGKKPYYAVDKELNFDNYSKEYDKASDLLLKFGGFPEPLFKQSEKDLRRWLNERLDRLVMNDIRDIENIRNLSLMQVLVDLMPSKVSSVLSINSLREDIEVSHKTISSWIDILERFYYCFRIYPFYSSKIKSLRKEPKVYLWDWSEIEEDGAKYENIIASHLIKFCHYLYDAEGYKAELHYIRDREKREVDFLISVNKKPWFCVEAKKSLGNVPASLLYFKEKLSIPYNYIVVQEKGIDKMQKEVRIISFDKFLSSLI